jgi:hypothetical protein
MDTVRLWANNGLIPMYMRLTKREYKKMIQRERQRDLLLQLRAPSIRELAELIEKNAPKEEPVIRFGVFDEPNKMLPISCYLPEPFGADEKRKTKPEKRPGRYTEWSKDALVEAAAVWATKHQNRDCKGNAIPPKSVSREIIGTVQLIARDVYKHPHPYYRIKDRMIDGLWPDPPFTYKDVEMKLVRDDKLNQLTRAYIAAVEKARRGISVTGPKRVILKEDISERDDVHLDESRSKARLDKKLAEAAEKKGQELTRDEVQRIEKFYQNFERTSAVVCSDISTEIQPTKTNCDEIELWVRQPSSKTWVDSRKLAMRCARVVI